MSMGPYRRRRGVVCMLMFLCCYCRCLSFVNFTPRARTPGYRHEIHMPHSIAHLSGGRLSRSIMHKTCRSLLDMTTTGSAEGMSIGVDVTGSEPLNPTPQREPEALSPKEGGSVEETEDETPLTLDRALEEGVNRALRGDPAILRQVLGRDAAWTGPLGRIVGLEAIEKELRGIGQLLSDPRLTIISTKRGSSELEWVASGTWPLPWLPRYIVRGKSTIQISGVGSKVTEIADVWNGNLLSLALKHLVPGFWDIWHQLGSPPAEKQPYKTLRRGNGYEIREYVPRLVMQPSVVDRSQERELRNALVLPDFCHAGNIQTSGRRPDEYFVTSPIEVTIQPFVETGDFPEGNFFNGTVRPASKVRRVNRISWSVTVPTAFGLNADALPPATRDPNTDQGEAASILQQGFRKVAVVPFNGLPQDPEASQIRAKLLSQLETDGVKLKASEDGRVLNGIFMHNSCACFNKRGQLGMSILYYRPPWIGIGNEIYVEIEDERQTKEIG